MGQRIKHIKQIKTKRAESRQFKVKIWINLSQEKCQINEYQLKECTFLKPIGSDCSTVVERMPYNQEVVGSKLAR